MGVPLTPVKFGLYEAGVAVWFIGIYHYSMGIAIPLGYAHGNGEIVLVVEVLTLPVFIPALLVPSEVPKRIDRKNSIKSDRYIKA